MPTVLSNEEFSSEDLNVLRNLYWKLEDQATKTWKCQQCPEGQGKRVKGNGWSNLDSHLFTKHLDCKAKLAESKKSANKSISGFFNKASDDARNFHDWIEWMVMNDESPTFCENQYVRKNTAGTLRSLNSKTLLKY
jgi:hypothetical protein